MRLTESATCKNIKMNQMRVPSLFITNFFFKKINICTMIKKFHLSYFCEGSVAAVLQCSISEGYVYLMLQWRTFPSRKGISSFLETRSLSFSLYTSTWQKRLASVQTQLGSVTRSMNACTVVPKSDNNSQACLLYLSLIHI